MQQQKQIPKLSNTGNSFMYSISSSLQQNHPYIQTDYCMETASNNIESDRYNLYAPANNYSSHTIDQAHKTKLHTQQEISLSNSNISNIIGKGINNLSQQQNTLERNNFQVIANYGEIPWLNQQTIQNSQYNQNCYFMNEANSKIETVRCSNNFLSARETSAQCNKNHQQILNQNNKKTFYSLKNQVDILTGQTQSNLKEMPINILNMNQQDEGGDQQIKQIVQDSKQNYLLQKSITNKDGNIYKNNIQQRSSVNQLTNNINNENKMNIELYGQMTENQIIQYNNLNNLNYQRKNSVQYEYFENSNVNNRNNNSSFRDTQYQSQCERNKSLNDLSQRNYLSQTNGFSQVNGESQTKIQNQGIDYNQCKNLYQMNEQSQFIKPNFYNIGSINQYIQNVEQNLNKDYSNDIQSFNTHQQQNIVSYNSFPSQFEQKNTNMFSEIEYSDQLNKGQFNEQRINSNQELTNSRKLVSTQLYNLQQLPLGIDQQQMNMNQPLINKNYQQQQNQIDQLPTYNNQINNYNPILFHGQKPLAKSNLLHYETNDISTRKNSIDKDNSLTLQELTTSVLWNNQENNQNQVNFIKVQNQNKDIECKKQLGIQPPKIFRQRHKTTINEFDQNHRNFKTSKNNISICQVASNVNKSYDILKDQNQENILLQGIFPSSTSSNKLLSQKTQNFNQQNQYSQNLPSKLIECHGNQCIDNRSKQFDIKNNQIENKINYMNQQNSSNFDYGHSFHFNERSSAMNNSKANKSQQNSSILAIQQNQNHNQQQSYDLVMNLQKNNSSFINQNTQDLMTFQQCNYNSNSLNINSQNTQINNNFEIDQKNKKNNYSVNFNNINILTDFNEMSNYCYNQPQKTDQNIYINQKDSEYYSQKNNTFNLINSKNNSQNYLNGQVNNNINKDSINLLTDSKISSNFNNIYNISFQQEQNNFMDNQVQNDSRNQIISQQECHKLQNNNMKNENFRKSSKSVYLQSQNFEINEQNIYQFNQINSKQIQIDHSNKQIKSERMEKQKNMSQKRKRSNQIISQQLSNINRLIQDQEYGFIDNDFQSTNKQIQLPLKSQETQFDYINNSNNNSFNNSNNINKDIINNINYDNIYDQLKQNEINNKYTNNNNLSIYNDKNNYNSSNNNENNGDNSNALKLTIIPNKKKVSKSFLLPSKQQNQQPKNNLNNQNSSFLKLNNNHNLLQATELPYEDQTSDTQSQLNGNKSKGYNCQIIKQLQNNTQAQRTIINSSRNCDKQESNQRNAIKTNNKIFNLFHQNNLNNNKKSSHEDQNNYKTQWNITQNNEHNNKENLEYLNNVDRNIKSQISNQKLNNLDNTSHQQNNNYYQQSMNYQNNYLQKNSIVQNQYLQNDINNNEFNQIYNATNILNQSNQNQNNNILLQNLNVIDKQNQIKYEQNQHNLSFSQINNQQFQYETGADIQNNTQKNSFVEVLLSKNNIKNSKQNLSFISNNDSNLITNIYKNNCSNAIQTLHGTTSNLYDGNVSRREIQEFNTNEIYDNKQKTRGNQKFINLLGTKNSYDNITNIQTNIDFTKGQKIKNYQISNKSLKESFLNNQNSSNKVLNQNSSCLIACQNGFLNTNNQNIINQNEFTSNIIQSQFNQTKNQNLFNGTINQSELNSTSSDNQFNTTNSYTQFNTTRDNSSSNLQNINCIDKELEKQKKRFAEQETKISKLKFQKNIQTHRDNQVIASQSNLSSFRSQNEYEYRQDSIMNQKSNGNEIINKISQRFKNIKDKQITNQQETFCSKQQSYYNDENLSQNCLNQLHIQNTGNNTSQQPSDINPFGKFQNKQSQKQINKGSTLSQTSQHVNTKKQTYDSQKIFKTQYETTKQNQNKNTIKNKSQDKNQEYYSSSSLPHSSSPTTSPETSSPQFVINEQLNTRAEQIQVSFKYQPTTLTMQEQLQMFDIEEKFEKNGSHVQQIDDISSVIECEQDYFIDYSKILKNPNITQLSQCNLIDWVQRQGMKFFLKRETIHKAIYYINKYLSNNTSLKEDQLYLIAITCIFLASKQEEIYPPTLNNLLVGSQYASQQNIINKQEIQIIESLKWKLNPITACFWMDFVMAQWDKMLQTNSMIPLPFRIKDKSSYMRYREAYQMIDYILLNNSILQQYNLRILCITVVYLVVCKSQGVNSEVNNQIDDILQDKNFLAFFKVSILEIKECSNNIQRYFQNQILDYEMPNALKQNNYNQKSYEEFLGFQSYTSNNKLLFEQMLTQQQN